jgi:hypothetical protein
VILIGQAAPAIPQAMEYKFCPDCRPGQPSRHLASTLNFEDTFVYAMLGRSERLFVGASNFTATQLPGGHSAIPSLAPRLVARLEPLNELKVRAEERFIWNNEAKVFEANLVFGDDEENRSLADRFAQREEISLVLRIYLIDDMAGQPLLHQVGKTLPVRLDTRKQT